MANQAPLPFGKRLLNAGTGLLSKDWTDWFLALLLRITETMRRLQVVELTAKSAAIGATPMATNSTNAGLYRITYSLRTPVPASVNSSVTLTIAWIDESGFIKTITFAALAGNTTAQHQSDSILIRRQGSSALTYAFAYASVGTAMQFAADIIVEEVTG